MDWIMIVKALSLTLNDVIVKNPKIYHALWILIFILSLASCEVIGAGGSIGLGAIAAVIGGILLLGWLALKVLGGIIEIGFWGITVIILLIIGFIAFIIVQSMGT